MSVNQTGSRSTLSKVRHRNEAFKKFDSMFLGAIGHPEVKPGILEVGILPKRVSEKWCQG
jgi:hypothetical protein